MNSEELRELCEVWARSLRRFSASDERIVPMAKATLSALDEIEHLRRTVSNREAQLAYMCEEIAAALRLEKAPPVETVQAVRDRIRIGPL